jgi:putative ABC transport system permease protein
MAFGMSWIDWKLGGRMLLKFPGLSVVGGITLAVAIGLGAGWFEVTRQLVNPRLPLPDGDRIVRIENWDAAQSSVETRTMYDFQLWREQLTSIKELGAYRSYERNLIAPDGSAQPATFAEITASAFPLTRVSPILGRTLVEADAQAGAPEVIVIGHDVWQRRFNGDRGVIGLAIKIGRTPATIVGVMPQGFGFPFSHQVWVPLRLVSTTPREGPSINVFGRLAAGATLESAQVELSAIGRRIASVNPTTHAQLRPRVALYAAISGDETTLVRLSNIIGWLILAAACANVATLLFARTATRESEIVVRNALGASRMRVMMQLLVEAFVLCAAAAIVGLTAASFGLDFASRVLAGQNGTPFWLQFTVGPVTVMYAAILAFGGAILVGLLPALRATGPRVQRALTQVSTGSTNIQFGGVWSALIVLQVLSATLCLPLAVFVPFWTLHDLPSRSGFATNEYLTFRPELDRDAGPNSSGELTNLYDALKRRLEQEPFVSAVTFANGLPGAYFELRPMEAQRGGATPFTVDSNIESNLVKMATVDIGFFDTFGQPLVAGRAFHAGDVEAGNVAIINESLARNIGGNPLGVRIRYTARNAQQQPSPWYEVVGIVRDAPVETKGSDFAYVPTSVATVSPINIAIHVRGDARALAPRVSALAAEVEPGLRLYNLLSLEELLRRRKLPEIQGMFAILAMTILILALSAAGLYALMSVAVTRRTREIGIRLAIGASTRAVLTAIFARAATQIGAGIVLANVLYPPLMKAIGLSELPVRFVVISTLVASGGMLLTGFIACAVPARRALRIEPTEAVKYAG